MTEDHKKKISDSNKARHASMSEKEKKAWQAKRLAGRIKTNELIKQLREQVRQSSEK